MMPATVGKCLCGVSRPPLHPRRVRSLSCCRQPTDGGHPSHDAQLTITGGNAFMVNCLTAKHFSTADQGSTGPTRASARSTVKEWMQQQLARKPNFDLQGVARILSPLHIDLPKLIPYYKVGWFTVKAVPAVAEGKKTERSDDSVAETETKDVVKEQEMAVLVEKVKNKPRSVFEVYGSQETEKHDFAKAMFSTHESIETFNSEQAKVQEIILSHSAEQKDSKPARPSQERSLSVIGKNQLMPSNQSFASLAVATATTVTTTIVKQITSYLPSIGTTQQKKLDEPKSASGSMTLREAQKEDPLSPKKTALPAKRVLVAKGSIDRRTRALVISLREAKTSISQAVRLEELCQHLLQYPDTRNVAVKDKLIPCLLRLRVSRDAALRENAMEALALIGFMDPVRKRGVRILALDGGGTKGLIAIEIMKKLEEISQKRIHDLFDYVCGVSTGALIAVMATAFRVPLIESEQVYKEFSSQMFARNKLVGAGKLFMSHAYYDTQLWEKILVENIGEKTFLATTRDPLCAKVSAVSTLMNVSRVQNFIFRNYNLPPGRESHYVGSIEHRLWEAIRASSAAPGYFEEFQLDDHVHQDGGLLTNNPAAIAIHECQLLWPNEPLQCVVSIGTGRHETIDELESVSKSSLKAKVNKVIQSATDTEAVHTVLCDLLKPSTYFRFNPYMSEDFVLDEIREAKWNQMKQDTEMYCRKNLLQLEKATHKLLEPRPTYQKAVDWLKLQKATIGR